MAWILKIACFLLILSALYLHTTSTRLIHPTKPNSSQTMSEQPWNVQRLDKEYLWIDTDVGMDDLFAIQITMLHLDARKNTQQEMVLSAISSVYGMTPNATNGLDIVKELMVYNLPLGATSPVYPQSPIMGDLSTGSHHALHDNEASFTFKDADFYQSVELMQTQFLKKMNWNVEYQDSTSDNHHHETFFEPMFRLDHQNRASLEDLPDNSLTILALGPLTNLAKWIRGTITATGNDTHAIQLLRRKVKRIVSMGGNALFTDNTDIEWNYHCDAKSVQQVIETFSDKFYMVGLDVANDKAITQPQLLQLKQTLLQKLSHPLYNSHRVAALLYNLLEINPASCTYDPITASYLIRPDLFEFEQVNVAVDLVQTESSFAGRILKIANGTPINVARTFSSSSYYEFLQALFTNF